MKLSILICSLPERVDGLIRLMFRLQKQITAEKQVEIVALTDNRSRSTGLKRQALLDSARGDYITFLDDDDLVSSRYIETILPAIDENPDVICFNSIASIDQGNPFIVRASLAFENQQCFQVNGIWQPITRKPWHWCVWKREIAQQGKFPDAYIDDDWFWIRQLLKIAKREIRIKDELHFYNYSSGGSASHQGESVTDGKELPS